MPAKSRFTRLDAFTKTVDEARIRTTSGGVVTLASLMIIFWLAWGEWCNYQRIIVQPELVVDKGRNEKMEIHINITFPRIPCEILTLDVMDVSGEQQTGLMHGVNKVRLSSIADGGRVIDIKSINLHQNDQAIHLDPDYCGPCYGAEAPSNAKKLGCCSTCDEVREAYASNSWAFGRGENVEQCEREHYAERLDEQRNEGCRIEGAIRVNKVVGNFHIAPGRSFSNGNIHVHDLNNYFDSPKPGAHVFTHKIHSLRFGPQLPDSVLKKMGNKVSPWTNHHGNPLDNTEQATDEPAYNFMYFIKVVSTSYLPIGWEKPSHDNLIKDENAGLGVYGHKDDGSLETHQYSVTSHRRSLGGGDELAYGHQEKLHARGGIPGVFFSYDISPMKVINREERSKNFTGFLTGLCSIVGGTLTVAATIDRGFYEGSTRLRKLRSKNI